jgi:integrase
VYTLGAIKQVLGYGISSGLIAVNVAASVKPPRKQHGDSKPKIIWTPEELIQFRAVADQDEWAAAWRLTLSGLRRSEVLGMKWTAVDLAAVHLARYVTPTEKGARTAASGLGAAISELG